MKKLNINWPPLSTWRCLILAGALLAGFAHGAPSIFYVATNGNDQWSGSRPRANLARTDGPLATIARALDATRQWRLLGATPGQPVIRIAPGTYELADPLILRPQDSGLTIAASSADKPILSGGRRISGWKKDVRDGKTFWIADLPEVRNRNWYFRELWVNGRRAVRARSPNHGYFKVEELVDSAPDWSRAQSRFRYAQGDLQPWDGMTNAEVVVMNRWADSRLPISHVDPEQRLVQFSKRAVFALDKGDLYYLEGTFEALDQPGEWYLDRTSGTLYYLPRPGESIERLEAVAPILTQVLRVEGDPASGQFVEHIGLHGLCFSHTEWCFPEGFSNSKDKPEVYPAPEAQVGGFAQAEIGVPGALWGQGVRTSTFEGCSFHNIGNYGLELGRGCQSNRITRCEFSELGAGGLKLGETAIRGAVSDRASDNEISDCHIHDGGQMFHSAIGIWIGQSANNRILHNLIHDFYYTGISIGWTWGYGAALASNNVVAANYVHHIGLKSDGDGPILSDMGGIYTLGKQPGTIILNNLWHDIAGLRYGGWGIYLDEGSSGILVASNVVHHTTHGGFHQHYGETNRVQNNIFAFGRDQQLQRTRPEPHQSFSFQTNIIYFNTGALLSGDWSGDQFQIDWNLYFDTRAAAQGKPINFSNATLQEWRERGHDVHSVFGDPLFVAPDANDFRLRPGSPALALGFEPIDLKNVGIRKSRR